MRHLALIAVGLVLGVAGTLGIQHFTSAHDDHAPYAGQQTRLVASLSDSEVDALSEGKGWGLAKPAELNGYPGPLHVLELAGDLGLDGKQRDTVQRSFERMQSRARELGHALIVAEAEIDALFKTATADPETLNARLAVSERLRSELRASHLLAHIEVTPVLTADQRATYKHLRGYDHAHGSH
jgi:Heavy-metal resistance